MNIGLGNNLGLPYHLSSKGKFLGLLTDGQSATSAATCGYALVTGLTLATISTSTGGCPDVRGCIAVTGAGVIPDGTKLLTAMMVIDHSTRDKAYGVPQATTCTWK